MGQRKVIIITGQIGAGKTTFLSNMATLLRKRWSVDGFLTLPTKRPAGSEQRATSYQLKFIKESSLYPWAIKKEQGIGFNFIEETINTIEKRLLTPQALSNDLLIIDNLGLLEVEGKGFYNLFKTALNSNEKAIIVSVKKEAIEIFIKTFNIENSSIIDLDKIKGKQRKKELFHHLNQLDSEDIGIFSTINGVIEVSFGSALHAIRLPMKGYLLVGIQNFFLILFAKELKGRGLFWITLISSGMKSFSPAGGRLKPMIYIFLQGLFFLFPTSVLGWNFFTALWGSLLIQISSLCFKFLAAYMMFGKSVFEAYTNGFNAVLEYLSLPSVSLLGIIIFLAIMKMIIAFFIAITAYYFDFSKIIFRWRHKVNKMEANHIEGIQNFGWKDSMLGAFRDMALKRFILPFVMIVAMILLFANLSTSNIIGTIIRALVISWLAFVISRRINYNSLFIFLRKKRLSHIADAMEKAIGIVQVFRKK